MLSTVKPRLSSAVILVDLLEFHLEAVVAAVAVVLEAALVTFLRKLRTNLFIE